MSTKILEQVKRLFYKLSKKEHRALLKQIEELIGLGDDACDLFHQIRSGQFNEGFKCPHCKSTNAIKHGK